MIPKEAIDIIETLVAAGKDVLVKKEQGRWVVLENKRRLVYKQPVTDTKE